MSFTIFFSWQADSPLEGGRSFLERALKRALAIIAEDATVEKAIREGITFDKDTLGVGGQPPIVDTIFKKIDSSAVFVPDLTFVGKRLDGRPTPNPNVLIEYGWALKSLGHSRIVPVMNVAFGKPTAETMPFDMGHLRFPLTYNLREKSDATTIDTEMEILAKEFAQQIRTVLNSPEFKSTLPKASKPPAFPAAEPKDGPGKFRKKGEPLGISEDHFLGRQEKAFLLSDGPAMWLRIMPHVDTGHRFGVMELAKAVKDQRSLLLPILRSYSGFDFLRAVDGFGTCAVLSRDGTETPGVVMIFQTGEIWSVDTYLLTAGDRGIPFLEPIFKDALKNYVSFLQRLSIPPPYRWIAGVEDIQGKGLYYPPPPQQRFILPGPYGKCLTDIISYEGTFNSGDTPVEVLRPFFKKLFDNFGRERQDYLDTAVE